MDVRESLMEELKDAEFKAEFEALAPEYQLIKDRLNSGPAAIENGEPLETAALESATIPPKPRVYLDNCCFNRPYDDQSQLRISLETQAKLYIQSEITADHLELASSYMLDYECSRNPHEMRRSTIRSFLDKNTSVYLDEAHHKEQVGKLAKEITATGVKPADAIHTACAILTDCDYLLTTDDRLLKYRSDQIEVIDPIEFIKRTGGDNID